MLQSLQPLFIGQQYHWLHEMQQTHRVWQDERTGEWHVFHYEDVKHVLSDYATFSSQREPNTEVSRQFMENSFLMMDPPQHRRYRGLVASVFTPRAISTRAARIKEIVQEQVDRVRPTGRMEVVGDLAYPLPVTVIAEMLGLPAEDHDRFRGWAHQLLPQDEETDLPQAARDKLVQRLQAADEADLPHPAREKLIQYIQTPGRAALPPEVKARLIQRLQSQGLAGLPSRAQAWLLQSLQTEGQTDRSSPQDNERLQRRLAIVQEMNAYFLQKIEERRQHPQEDILTGLVHAEVEGVRLTAEEILGFARLLLIAGHASTVALLSTAILCLDEYPDVREQVRQHPELVSGTIEEVLRYAFVLKPLKRRTTVDVQIGEAHIPAQSPVLAWVSAANHDPAQFAEPERFDIRRSPNRHLTFGHGIHACIGAPLARLEASIALPLMLEQLPQMQRVPGSPLDILESGSFLWFRRLPITFQPSPSARPIAS